MKIHQHVKVEYQKYLLGKKINLKCIKERNEKRTVLMR